MNVEFYSIIFEAIVLYGWERISYEKKNEIHYKVNYVKDKFADKDGSEIIIHLPYLSLQNIIVVREEKVEIGGKVSDESGVG